MTPDGIRILDSLQGVAAERMSRRADAALDQGVQAVKAYQHRRFALTYADLLADVRFSKAARFFLDDLYGPHDFTQRDEQFARVVPSLVRLFPGEIVATVRSLAELHAISEMLDSRMGRAMCGGAITAADYASAWRKVGEVALRDRQIELMFEVGGALARYTRNPLLRHSLRLMRAPARAAGLGSLQQFLERGFDTFREMRGPTDFLDTVAQRERDLSKALFAGDGESMDAQTASWLP